jgi:hypothetical protein
VICVFPVGVGNPTERGEVPLLSRAQEAPKSFGQTLDILERRGRCASEKFPDKAKIRVAVSGLVAALGLAVELLVEGLRHDTNHFFELRLTDTLQ